MNPIDQLRPPVSLPPSVRVQRKKRSTRDSNREPRSQKKNSPDERKSHKSEHIDKLI